MNTPRTRREFLGQVGQGTLLATVGCGIANELGLAPAHAADAPPPEDLTFGTLEPLVRLMQDTPAQKLIPALVEKLKGGTDLRTLMTAGAYANARTFGGQDYVGFHTVMAMGPAYHMSQEMPKGQDALPILKVLYRNTDCIQGHGCHASEVMHKVEAPEGSKPISPEDLQAIVRKNEMKQAEQAFATLMQSPEDAFNHLLYAVQDHTEVHRVVLPYRSWELLGMIGMEQAHTMLRQSLRYCVGTGASETSTLLPKLLEEHKLLDKTPGTRKGDDAWVEELSKNIFSSTAPQAAAVAAAALAEGFAPEDVGEAITLAANQLVLRDVGRTAAMETNNKPLGSVHGDSIGVHACDSANAWRNMASVSNARNTYACLILGAYQVALDRVQRGGDFLHWSPLPLNQHVKGITTTDPKKILENAEGAIRGNMQAHACAAIARYGELNHDPRAAFDLMLKYAVSEDGALHAEKFYRTNYEEFAKARPAFRWRFLVALARVTASEYGKPGAGVAEARQLLRV